MYPSIINHTLSIEDFMLLPYIAPTTFFRKEIEIKKGEEIWEKNEKNDVWHF